MDNFEHNDHLPLVGISSCLMGQRVRYDGKHKFQPSVIERIKPHVRLLPLCPESMAGMGIPRPPVNLVCKQADTRAIGRDNPHHDVTERLISVGKMVSNTYPLLCGYIVQSKSPSCGFRNTPIYSHDQQQIVRSDGDGLFIATLLDCLTDLPIISEQELEPAHIKLFLEHVNARHTQLRLHNFSNG
jgi:uncharacterized protein YbbK (DUF523 family)